MRNHFLFFEEAKKKQKIFKSSIKNNEGIWIASMETTVIPARTEG